MGLIAGGLTNGVVSVWDPASLQLDGSEGKPLATEAKHAGAVTALDWNPSMTNLLASGGSDGQLLIYDMVKPESPSVYVPGARIKPVSEAMMSVAWNRSASVPHILAGGLAGGAAEVWDLKNKKQVITFHDLKRCTKAGQRSLAWHPTEPTMIVQVCEGDDSPVLLLWDLKHYAAPVAAMTGHKRGITSVAWSAEDPSLVVSCSRDGTSLIWDITTGVVRSSLTAAVPVGLQSTDAPCHTQVVFAPKIPGHLATASSDGVVRVHALIDTGPRGQVTKANPLGPAPEWLKRPCGASFGFGGRLLRFNALSKDVTIAKIVTDQALVDQARELQDKTASPEGLAELCESKSSGDDAEARVWAQVGARLRGEDGKTALLTALEINDPSASKEAEGSADAPEEEGAEGGANQPDAFEAIAAETPEAASVPDSWDSEAPLWGKAEWEATAGRLVCSGNVRGAWKACASASQWPTAMLLARELGGDAEYAECRAAWLRSSTAPGLVTGIVRALGGPPEKLVQEGPLDEWKSLAAAALAWGKADAHRLLSLLGNRLKEKGNLTAAQLCFVGANDFDRLESHQESNIDCVQRLLCASRAFGVKLAPHGSRLAYHLSALAEALASQADMEGALFWLEQIDQPARAPIEVRLLYERLRAAKAPVAAPAPAAATPAASKPSLGNVQMHPSPVHQTPMPAKMASVAPFAQPSRQTVPLPNVPMSVPSPMQTTSSQAPQPLPNVAAARAVPVPMPMYGQGPTTVAAPSPSTYSTPAPTRAVASPPANAPTGPTVDPAVAQVCARLLNVAASLGASNDQAKKFADEVAKRLPAVEAKLGAASKTETVVALLESLASAMESRDAVTADSLYKEASQKHHSQLGSTGMLALKRCVDVVKKST